MADPLILGFDTSAAYCAALLLRGTEVLAERHEDMQKGQSERLVPLLEEVLSAGQASWQDLDALGVGTGPGNFTGLRIAVSAARGLALGLKIPAIGVTILDVLAFGTDTPVLSAIDARRGQAYVQLHGRGIYPDQPPRLSPISDLRDSFAGVPCIGSAAEAVAEQTGALASPAQFAPASAIARIALSRMEKEHPRPAPFYLREADAAPSRDKPPTMLS